MEVRSHLICTQTSTLATPVAKCIELNPYWTGRTDMSLPGKGREGHICPSAVTSPWGHWNVI